MFFSRSNLEAVLRGKKVQTRRLSGRYKVGHTYGIRTWIYEKSLAKIRITGKRQERLGDISEADARRESYKDVEEFKRVWSGLHRKMGWQPGLIVYVYDFVLVEAPVGQPLPIVWKKPRRANSAYIRLVMERQRRKKLPKKQKRGSNPLSHPEGP